MLPLYLEGQFGSYSAGDLVDDLSVKAATVVHVSHHDWKKLNRKSICVTVHTSKIYVKRLTDGIHCDFRAAYLCWTHLLCSNVRSTEPVG